MSFGLYLVGFVILVGGLERNRIVGSCDLDGRQSHAPKRIRAAREALQRQVANTARLQGQAVLFLANRVCWRGGIGDERLFLMAGAFLEAARYRACALRRACVRAAFNFVIQGEYA
jgi:hypothetical protein